MKNFSAKSAAINLLLVFIFTLVAALPALAATERYVPGEAIVVIGDQIDPAATRSVRSASDRAATLARSAGARAARTYSALSEADGSVYALIRSETQSTEELIESLKADPSVIAASPNWIVHTRAVPTDEYYGYLWGMKAIGAEAAWDITSGDETVYVAVLDTGIQRDHPDLAANIAMQYARNVTKDVPDNDVEDGGADGGHGTHVSGTIGAVGSNDIGVAGVNWRVKIIPVKVFDDEGYGPLAWQIAGIDYVVGLLKENPSMKMAAVNYSAGWYGSMKPADSWSDPAWLALRALDSLNRAVFVTAAGNDGVEADAPLTQGISYGDSVIAFAGDYDYPTAYPGLNNMIVVGGIDEGKNAMSWLGGGTNWSRRTVHLVAPGLDILSTWVGSAYKSEGGNSMATPHVSGAAALLLARSPDLTASEIKRRLVATADGTVNPKFSMSIVPQFVPDTTVSSYGLLRIDRALSDDVTPDVVPATSIDITAPRLRVGERGMFVATVLPYDATNKSVTWESSDPAILTVDSYGVAHAHAKGHATVTAKVQNGSGETTSSLEIEVANASDRTDGDVDVGCSAFSGAVSLALAAAFLAARRHARVK